ncbi:MAG: DsrE family protein [Bacteroidia bacterium]|nr:DsrE family protein [Bacteroidia bacterium]
MKQISFFIFILLMVFSVSSFAQKKKHKIVFQFTNAQDTMQQKAFTNQLKNITTHWPDAQIEVVAYNHGIEYLMTSKSKHIEAIRELKSKGVRFVACENTMKQRKITKEDLIPEAETVPAGIAEIVEKQEKGWSYIKGGF